MYAEHNPQIAEAMADSAEGFTRGVAFTLLSIRQRFHLVPSMLSDVDRDGLASRHLWGWKRQGYAYACDHAEALRQSVLASETPKDAVSHLLQVPGLGIVKSAFVAQLAGFDIACVDSRNAARLGLDPEHWKGATPEKLDSYCELYSGQGRGEQFWNAWCTDVAQAYPGHYADANAVSADHLAVVRS
jgi:hypothetical protein